MVLKFNDKLFTFNPLTVMHMREKIAFFGGRNPFERAMQVKANS